MSRVVLIDGFVDLGAREVHRGGGVTTLRAKEAQLLGYLAEHSGRTVPRAELFAEVWGYHPDTRSRTLDTMIRILRARIEPDPHAPTHLHTAPGVGYRFEAAPPLDAAAAALADGVARLAQAARDARVVVVWGASGVGKSTWAAGLDGLPKAPVTRDPTALDRAAPALVVVDDADDPAWLERALRWTAATPDGRVVLVRRARPRHPDVVGLEVPPLPLDAARALFVRRARALVPTVAAVPALDAALDSLGGLPRAVELAAGLVDTGVEALAARLVADPAVVLTAPGGQRWAASLARAEAELSGEASALLGWLRGAGGPLPAGVLASTAPPAALGELVDAGLVLRDLAGRCVAIPPLRRPADDATRVRLGEALERHLVGRVHPVSGALTEEDEADLVACAPTFDALGPDAPEGVRVARVHAARILRRPLPEVEVPAPVWAMSCDEPGDARLRRLEAAPPGPDRGAATALALRLAGRLDAIPEPDPDAHGIAVGEWAFQLHLARWYQGDLAGAVAWIERALREWSRAPRLALFARLALGDAAVAGGDLARADSAFRSALHAVAPQLRFRAHTGLAFLSLARGDPAAARGWSERAEEAAHQLPGPIAFGGWYNLALLWRELGDTARVRGFAERMHGAGDGVAPSPHARRRARFLLASAALDEGRHTEALAGFLAVAEAGDTPAVERARALAFAAVVRELRGEPAGFAEAVAALDGADERATHLVRVLAGGPAEAAHAFAVRGSDPALLGVIGALTARDDQQLDALATDPGAYSFETRIAVRLARARRRANDGSDRSSTG